MRAFTVTNSQEILFLFLTFFTRYGLDALFYTVFQQTYQMGLTELH